LNDIFLKGQNGADLIAMHMNRYWSQNDSAFLMLGDDLELDIKPAH
jgi:hypothetical protein